MSWKSATCHRPAPRRREAGKGDQMETGYWGRVSRARIHRRRLMLFGGAGATLAVAATSLACGLGAQSKKGAAAVVGLPNSEAPQMGGMLSYYLIGNPPSLDPQRTTAAPTFRTVGGVYSRLFRFKTAHD